VSRAAAGPSVAGILDDGGAVVSSVAAPWVGVLWLTAVPLRLVQARFAARVAELGSEAHSYGDHLRSLALAAAVAFLLSLWGRAVFVRACSLHLRGLAQLGSKPLRLPLGSFAAYVYAALVIEVGFYATFATGIAIPVAILIAGLAAATFPLVERAGLLGPFALIARNGRHGGALSGLLVVFAAAFALAAVNLFFVFQAGLWLAGGFADLDAARWHGLLSPRNPRFLFVLLAGGGLAVEPHWLASLAVYVHRLQSRGSGEDLRLWFERLRSVEG